jgi:hypothetical protein
VVPRGLTPEAVLRLQATAGNAAVARMVSRRCACGGAVPPGEDECADCRRTRLEGSAGEAAVQRDDRAPGDTAPQDAVDLAAGGRARSNFLFGRQCEPYADGQTANAAQLAMLTAVPASVWAAISSPAAGDVAAVWVRYLLGAGGIEHHDGIAAPGDAIATAFRIDDRHATHEQDVLDRVEQNLQPFLPRLAGRDSITLTLDELGIAGALRTPAPYYDSDYTTVAANLAGGIGSSDFGVDARRLDGRITLTKLADRNNRLWCEIGMSAEFDWTVTDGIDFCPGNAGNWHQEALTIPMSRLEATGVARDVGLLVRFRRTAHRTSRSVPNPDFQTPEAQGGAPTADGGGAASPPDAGGQTP